MERNPAIEPGNRAHAFYRRSVWVFWLALSSGCFQIASQEPSCVLSIGQTECGGNIAGTWTLGACYGQFGGGTLSVDGEVSITFDADGGYVRSGTGAGFTIGLPSSSFPDGGAASGCASLDAEALTLDGGCASGGAGDCRCTYPMSSVEASGPYRTTANRLSLPLGVGPFAPVVTETYCAFEDRLTLGTGLGNFWGEAQFNRQ